LPSLLPPKIVINNEEDQSLDLIPRDRLILLSTSGKSEGGINPSIAKELAPWTADQTITSPPLRALLSITP
jgi:hypothetical protein